MYLGRNGGGKRRCIIIKRIGCHEKKIPRAVLIYFMCPKNRVCRKNENKGKTDRKDEQAATA